MGGGKDHKKMSSRGGKLVGVVTVSHISQLEPWQLPHVRINVLQVKDSALASERTIER